ncbi:MAG: hypothetical protein V4787_03135 [Pseudomonadota bacterium]
MEEQTESWQLGSGSWCRDPESETWRLAASCDGTAVAARLGAQDVRRMIGARRDASTGQWFPPDFNYSPQTGAQLHDTVVCRDSPWVPPFGASTFADTSTPQPGGLRQTAASLLLARSDGRIDPTSDADRTLPALPPGQYRFLVHKFDVASSILMAIEPQQGKLLVLLPESMAWIALEAKDGATLAPGPKNFRGWRMEVAGDDRGAKLYFPTEGGLAVVTPTLIGLSYTVEYFAEGPALGGPVAWAGEVWLPQRSKDGTVNLVGKPLGEDETAVLATGIVAPSHGFEAPVFDSLHVIWPSEEGQLVVRLNQAGKKKSDWIAWPQGLRPAFSLGCPLFFESFWQQCRSGENEPLEYVQMGRLFPRRIPIEAPRLCTGRISYMDEQRVEGGPDAQPAQAAGRTSSQVVVPLIESEHDGAVVSLRIDAPDGVLALLDSNEEGHLAVLQLQAESRADVLFATLNVARPWLASLFVYNAHLWLHHPALAQTPGWKLESQGE